MYTDSEEVNVDHFCEVARKKLSFYLHYGLSRSDSKKRQLDSPLLNVMEVSFDYLLFIQYFKKVEIN